ncbi:MAG TPA: DUF1573 domain-containing protein [Gemmataceae bacterium]|nr:DUF1573 domain-containing protein [Gemmataceae bacterium]
MGRMPTILAAAALVALSTTTARADLSFPNPTVDVGEVRSGAPLRQRFAFVNEGPGSVEITGLQASCGCVKPVLGKRSYSPGESGEVALEVLTLSQPAGEHTWRLQVAYRAGGEPRQAELTLVGRVVAEVTVQPASLVISTEGTASHEITLTDLRDRPLSVTGVHTSSPHLTGEVRRTAADGAGHRAVTIGLSLGAGCPAGRHEETVVMLTDDPQYRELTMPVTVIKRAKQAVMASPASVSLTAAGGSVPSRIVLLRPGGDEAVAVEKVEVDHPAVVCTWAAGPDRCATLRVTIDRAKLPAEGLHATIHVHISKPAPATVDVPVTCRAD